MPDAQVQLGMIRTGEAHLIDSVVPSALSTLQGQQGITVEELKKDENFEPYFNLKVVLVEEAGQLKVGYVEFMPPSMMD